MKLLYPQELFTLLSQAAAQGMDECVTCFIQSGADVNRSDVNKVTALMMAAENGHVKCVNILIEAGADVNRISEIWSDSSSTECGEW